MKKSHFGMAKIEWASRKGMERYEIINKKDLGQLSNSIQAFQWVMIPGPCLGIMSGVDRVVNDP